MKRRGSDEDTAASHQPSGRSGEGEGGHRQMCCTPYRTDSCCWCCYCCSNNYYCCSYRRCRCRRRTCIRVRAKLMNPTNRFRRKGGQGGWARAAGLGPQPAAGPSTLQDTSSRASTVKMTRESDPTEISHISHFSPITVQSRGGRYHFACNKT